MILSHLRAVTLQAEYSPASFSLSADREYILLEYSTLQVRVDISRYQVILTWHCSFKLMRYDLFNSSNLLLIFWNFEQWLKIKVKAYNKILFRRWRIYFEQKLILLNLPCKLKGNWIFWQNITPVKWFRVADIRVCISIKALCDPPERWVSVDSVDISVDNVDNVDMQLSIISLIIFSAFQENLATNWFPRSR